MARMGSTACDLAAARTGMTTPSEASSSIASASAQGSSVAAERERQASVAAYTLLSGGSQGSVCPLQLPVPPQPRARSPYTGVSGVDFSCSVAPSSVGGGTSPTYPTGSFLALERGLRGAPLAPHLSLSLAVLSASLSSGWIVHCALQQSSQLHPLVSQLPLATGLAGLAGGSLALAGERLWRRLEGQLVARAACLVTAGALAGTLLQGGLEGTLRGARVGALGIGTVVTCRVLRTAWMHPVSSGTLLGAAWACLGIYLRAGSPIVPGLWDYLAATPAQGRLDLPAIWAAAAPFVPLFEIGMAAATGALTARLGRNLAPWPVLRAASLGVLLVAGAAGLGGEAAAAWALIAASGGLACAVLVPRPWAAVALGLGILLLCDPPVTMVSQAVSLPQLPSLLGTQLEEGAQYLAALLLQVHGALASLARVIVIQSAGG